MTISRKCSYFLNNYAQIITVDNKSTDSGGFEKFFGM